MEKKNTEGLHLFFSHGSINREPNSKGKPTAHPLRAQAASLTTPSPHHITNDGARGTNEAIHLPFILFAFFSSFFPNLCFGSSSSSHASNRPCSTLRARALANGKVSCRGVAALHPESVQGTVKFVHCYKAEQTTPLYIFVH